MDINEQIIKILFEAIFGIATVLITGYLVPWIRNLLGESKYAMLTEYTSLAVRCAEQIYTPEQWEEKKKYVLNCVEGKAKSIGINLDAIEIENLIEGLVNEIKKG